MMAFSNTTGGKLEAAFLDGEIQRFKISQPESSQTFILEVFTHEEHHAEWHQNFVNESQNRGDRIYVIASHGNEERHKFIVCEVKPQGSEKPRKLIIKLKQAHPKPSVVRSKRV
ncbi:hypothetical protein [Aeromonas veronii]|uniref:hypothetical protein n=1 Tax=Aeromonas veronii TaxID=654 RepID=UPI0019312D28|nr:hypothetical protein [Aeromonas veronii]MBM0418809.1 hypothetical protein [Aeromonas veronii]MBW3789488.1 hypothetical protein [Aeromonas veronii]